MKVKYLLLLSCMAVVFSGTQAQVSLSAGYNFYPIGYPTFKKFAESYNSVNSALLSKSLDGFRPMTGFSYGLSWCWRGLFVEASYSRLKSRTNATFLNGNERKFDLQYNHFDLLLGFGFSNDNLGMWFYFGDNSANVKIKTAMYYPDGTMDMGFARDANGVYSALNIRIPVGVRIGIDLGPAVGLFLDASWVGKGLFLGINDGLTDSNLGKSENNAFAGDNSYEVLPVDIPGWYSAQANYQVYEGGAVQSDIRGVCIQARLKINLTEKDD